MEVKRALAEELIRQFVENMNRLGYTREQSVELLKKEEEKNAKSD